ncbi:hypothetical protein KIN20_007326 [Parelaphostrongylus tenuis]|uniref:Uncharacterized protein n=1 Tax=Parelaphostrongylus tenuis TaxID=148309 RepID=A0AAD5QJY3_PARTN|nr:hypothetical protein KIN20_007326 [Parelaphostrongylus tenuis]
MDVMESALSSSAVETGRYDCMVAANSAELEAVGILNDPTSNDDEECLRFFNNAISYDRVNKRYNNIKDNRMLLHGAAARSIWCVQRLMVKQQRTSSSHRTICSPDAP